MRVQAGKAHRFLGPNGSGESTTIRVLFGRLRADSGTVNPPSPERLFLRLYEAKERSCLLVPRRRGAGRPRCSRCAARAGPCRRRNARSR
nr:MULTISPECIES: ATP-binding cassette domain-containing protein [unclassified Leucobacter]